MADSFGKTVRALRREQDINGAELARRAGITRAYLSDIELDRRIPSEGLIARLAEVLGQDAQTMCKLAGRLSDDSMDYLKRNPLAGKLIRCMAEARLDDADIERLLKMVDGMGMPRVGALVD